MFGVTAKTPKQLLLEFYHQYPEAQKPSFQTIEIPGATPQSQAAYQCTVLCPAVHRAPQDLAFDDLMFEGLGKSKKAAEHDCADKAFAFIRNVPGLRLPSSSLSALPLGAQGPGVAQQQAAVPARMAAAQMFAPVATAASPPPALPLSLTINEAMIDSMTPEQLKMALREVLGLYKGLVQSVQAENQRHATELQSILMRQL